MKDAQTNPVDTTEPSPHSCKFSISFETLGTASVSSVVKIGGAMVDLGREHRQTDTESERERV